MAFAFYSSPVGGLLITETSGALTSLTWASASAATPAATTPLLREAVRQLTAYFAGDLTRFDLPLAPKGSPFQQSVYQAMLDIPYGSTSTYGSIAKDLNSSAQPVGQACGANPLPVLVPCHRVLSATGLGGYSGRGGLETKTALLKLENAFPFLL